MAVVKLTLAFVQPQQWLMLAHHLQQMPCRYVARRLGRPDTKLAW